MACGVALGVVAAACSEPAHLESRWEALGTQATAELYATTERASAGLLEQIQDAYSRAEALLSRGEPDSELNLLNRHAADEPYAVQDPELYRAVKIARNWARVTEGAFDPTAAPLARLYRAGQEGPRIPNNEEVAEVLRHTGWSKLKLYPEAEAVRFRFPGMEVDLEGILAGYALDMAGRSFVRAGSRAGLLGLGATRYAWRRPPGRAGWDVPLVDPQDLGLQVGSVLLEDYALSVSGSFAAVHDDDVLPVGHIMDVARGGPADSDVLAAVAIADSAADADALARALYVMGSQRGSALLQRSHGVEALLLVQGARGPYLLASSTLRGRLTLEEGFAERIDDRVRYLLPPQALD